MPALEVWKHEPFVVSLHFQRINISILLEFFACTVCMS